MRKMGAFLAVLFIIAIVPVLLPYQSVFAKDAISVHSEDGDSVGIFGNIQIDKKTDGDVVVILGNASIMADVEGDVVAVFGDIHLDAEVSGDVVAILGKISLSEKAQVTGDVVSIGALEKHPEARILGQEVKVNTGILTLAGAALTVAEGFFTLILGLGIIAIFREGFRDMAISLECRLGRKILMGFVGLLACTVLIILLFITVIAPVLFMLLLTMAEIAAGIYTGRQILKIFSLYYSIYMEFISGLISITLVKIALIITLPQHSLGMYVILYIIYVILIKSLGLGILIDSGFIRRGPRRDGKDHRMGNPGEV